jgi:hypothetical protein
MAEQSPRVLSTDGLEEVRVVAALNPFETARIIRTFAPGRTLVQLLEEIGWAPREKCEPRITVSGEVIQSDGWDRIPDPGSLVTVRVIARGIDPVSWAVAAWLAIKATALAVPGAATIASGTTGALTTLGVGAGTAGVIGTGVGVTFGAGVIVGTGVMAYNAATGIAKPSGGFTGRAEGSPTLTGGGNRLTPFGPVWRVYGRHRISPPYAAKPYTEVSGTNQFLRMLFCLGYGPLEVTSLRIGETLLSSFIEVQSEIQQGESGDPALTLYTKDVDQLQVNANLVNDWPGPNGLGPWNERTTENDTVEIQLDLSYPGGWFNLSPEGRTGGLTIDFDIHIKRDQDPDTEPYWYAAQDYTDLLGRGLSWVSGTPGRFRKSLHDTEAHTDVLRIHTLNALPGLDANEKYDVRIRRAQVIWNPFYGGSHISVFTAFKSIHDSAPISLAKDLAVVAMRIKATDQLSGNVDTFNCIAQSKLPKYDPTDPSADPDGITDPYLTRNPAWAYLDVLRGSANARPVDASRIDLAGIADWADYCEPYPDGWKAVTENHSGSLAGSLSFSPSGATATLIATDDAAYVDFDLLTGTPAAGDTITGSVTGSCDIVTVAASDDVRYKHTFDAVFDFDTTIFEALQQIATAGRASFHVRDGLFSVVVDKPNSVVTQHFTPANSWGFVGRKRWLDRPLGLRLPLLNESADWEREEVIALDDDTEEQVGIYETLEQFGVTNVDRAWKEGRFQIAVARLRPEIFEFSADIEYMVCERGDRIRVTHDVAQFGLYFGRITDVTTDGGGNCTEVEIENLITYEAGENYGARIRLNDGQSVQEDVDNPATGDDVESSTVTFSTPLPPASVPAIHDVLMFGETGSETEDLMLIEIVPSNDLGARLICVHYDPAIYTADTAAIPAFTSNITLGADRKPQEPVIVQVIQESASMGVVLRDGGESVVQAVTFEVQFREVRSDGSTTEWWTWGKIPIGGDTIAHLSPLTQGRAYDIRVRSLSVADIPSSWIYKYNVVFEGTTVIAPIFKIAGLELVNYGNRTEFLGRDAHFQWRVRVPDLDLIKFRYGELGLTISDDPSAYAVETQNPFFLEFEVRVLDFTTRLPIRTEPIGKPEYSYNFARNLEDAVAENRSPRRTFLLDVAFRDILKKLGPRSTIVVSNPAPSVPASLTADDNVGSVVVDFQRPADGDYAGMLVYIGDTAGFTPDYDDPDADAYSGPIQIKKAAGTYYVKCMPYDEFAKDAVSGAIDTTDLNESSVLGPVTVTEAADATNLDEQATEFVGDPLFWNYSTDRFIWKEFDTLSGYTTSGGKISLIGWGFAEVFTVDPNPLGMQNPDPWVDWHRVKWRIIRDLGEGGETLIFESDEISITVPGYIPLFAATTFDQTCPPGTHTYTVQMMWMPKIYDAGTATVTVGAPWTITGSGTRFKKENELGGGSDTAGDIWLPQYFQWRESDGTYSPGGDDWTDIPADAPELDPNQSITSETSLALDSGGNVPDKRTGQRYRLVTIPTAGGLQVDKRRSYIEAVEFII